MSTCIFGARHDALRHSNSYFCAKKCIIPAQMGKLKHRTVKGLV